MASGTFVQNGSTIDYTPGSAVAAMDIVTVGNIVGVAPRDIAANELGCLQIDGVFDLPKTAGSSTAIAAGKKVYWTGSVVTETASTNKLLGYSVKAAGDDDTTVRVKLQCQG